MENIRENEGFIITSAIPVGSEEQARKDDRGYMLVATVSHEGNAAVIQFPTKDLGCVLESIGIARPPERVYLGGMPGVEVHLLHNGNQVADALAHLFGKDNSLRMVNEVAKAVFHSDWRVYEWVEERLKTDAYSDVERLLRDAVDYAKYIKDRQRNGGREER